MRWGIEFFCYLLSVFLPSIVCADALTESIGIAASGMRAQNERLKIVVENIANSEVTGANPDEEPYRRKEVIFKNVMDPELGARVVKMDRVVTDKSPFILKYEPNHPAADKNGYVRYPNVNTLIESADAKEAQRSFEANLASMEIAKSNLSKIIELIR